MMDPLFLFALGWLMGNRTQAESAPRPGATPSSPSKAPWPGSPADAGKSAMKGAAASAAQQAAEATVPEPAGKAAMKGGAAAAAEAAVCKPKSHATPGEVARAKELLASWEPGARWTEGSVQYRAAKHGSKRAIEVWQCG